MVSDAAATKAPIARKADQGDYNFTVTKIERARSQGKGKLPKELPAEADKWKGLALTKKRNITVHAHIPQRQFMGDSAELRVKVNKLINDSIQKIKDGIIALSAH